MVKEEFYFDSRDGKSRIHAVRYRPEDAGQIRCILQVVHGMAEYVERYEEFAAYLVERGFVVTGDDHLGHGKSVGEGGKQGYFCERDPATVLVRDVHRLKKLTEELYPGVPYVLMGHSMGSFIARNYLCRYGTGISGAVIMGTGMQPKAVLDMARLVAGIQKFFCGPMHVSRLLDRLAFGGYGKGITDRRTAFDWLSRDRERVDRYIADPMCGFTFTVNGFADFITVTDEDGNDFELELVDTLEHQGVTYYAMFPAVEEDEETGEPKDVDADDEEYGLVIMKAIEENGEELLSTLDSDEELDTVYELFMERFFQEDGEEPS